jgi:glycosyltransferase involved in cell wall biosynthesis
MSHSRPVVTTDVGDAAAIVGETGFVVRPGDPGALAAAMIRMMDLDPLDYATRAAAAREAIARNYSIAAVVRRIEAFVAEKAA